MHIHNSRVFHHSFSLLLFCFLLAVQSAPAQVSLEYYLPTDVTYDPAIPTPESFFGFQVGEWHLHPEQIHAYMRALSQASDRVSVEPMGKSYERRPIMLVTITSPENHRNLATIRQRHLAQSDPTRSRSADIESMPVVVWMGYSVHGNEPSGSNASPLVAYYLAAARGEEVEKFLREAVILLNPSINPDGLNRFATWANMHKGKQPVADPGSREHNEVWPGGRTNHYWFDLNRDWMPLQHPESRARLEKYYEWMPNVLTDHHEMGTNTTFFFQPGVASRENPLVPRTVRQLTAAIAEHHARALDTIGSLYYTQEGYDDFYIGKGSSYPDITGSVGILFEQASSRGHVQESIHGDITFPFTIRNQVVTSLSTVRASVALRKNLLEHQREYFVSALREAERAPVKAYVFSTAGDPARATHFLDILLQHKIDVYELARPIRHDGAMFEPSSSYIVPTSQRQFRLLTSLFERRTQFDDSLFYDISTWTLPLAFGLPYAELRTFAREMLGRRVDEPARPEGKVAGGSAYAYAFSWKDYYAPRALWRLQKAGIATRVATRPFESQTEAGAVSFDYGTILIPLGIQEEKRAELRALLETIAREDGIRIHAITSGLSASGIDLGSANFVPLQMPKVAVVVGAGVSPGSAGEVWHLLDHRMGMEVSLLEIPLLARVDLSRYSTIILPSGGYTGVDDAGKESLKQWIEKGGTLIALESAVEWVANSKLATVTLRRDTRRDTLVARRPYIEQEQHERAMTIPGTIFETRIDRTHPLLFGYEGDRLSVFRTTAVFMEPSASPYASPVMYTERPLLSGYLHQSRERHLKNSAAVNVSAQRSGRVILMTDNPVFRAFWFGTNRLFLNAIFFGSTIRAGSAR